MTKYEALNLALEALLSGSAYKTAQAINAVSEALEQPAPEADELAIAYMNGLYDGKKAEREACAKVCDEMEKKAEEHGTECCKWPTPGDCAYAIRARGNT
jgi:hypothetical protein